MKILNIFKKKQAKTNPVKIKLEKTQLEKVAGGVGTVTHPNDKGVSTG